MDWWNHDFFHVHEDNCSSNLEVITIEKLEA